MMKLLWASMVYVCVGTDVGIVRELWIFRFNLTLTHTWTRFTSEFVFDFWFFVTGRRSTGSFLFLVRLSFLMGVVAHISFCCWWTRSFDICQGSCLRFRVSQHIILFDEIDLCLLLHWSLLKCSLKFLFRGVVGWRIDTPPAFSF